MDRMAPRPARRADYGADGVRSPADASSTSAFAGGPVAGAGAAITRPRRRLRCHSTAT